MLFMRAKVKWSHAAVILCLFKDIQAITELQFATVWTVCAEDVRPIFVCLWGRIWATAITQHQPGTSCATAVFTEALGSNQTQVIILCFHFKLTAHELQINLMWTQNRRSPWQLAVPAENSRYYISWRHNVLSLCRFQALFSRREACHAFTQAAGFGWKTETQRYIHVHWCWQSICYVTVCTRGDLQATWGIHEKSGMMYSQQMQWVCDTSPEPQPKCHRWGFEYQVQKSPRRSPSSGNGVTYTHTVHKKFQLDSL